MILSFANNKALRPLLLTCNSDGAWVLPTSAVREIRASFQCFSIRSQRLGREPSGSSATSGLSVHFRPRSPLLIGTPLILWLHDIVFAVCTIVCQPNSSASCNLDRLFLNPDSKPRLFLLMTRSSTPPLRSAYLLALRSLTSLLSWLGLTYCLFS